MSCAWLVSQHHHQAEKACDTATYADDPVKPLGPLFERDTEVEQQGPPPQSQQQRNKKHSSHGVLAVILLTLDQSTGWIVQ
ncbi:hypothetical protein AERO9A_190264 [Aeromonas salmonicida]|nr:hypothetical protein AERO9A_190264 [Aeromonas salmonicida]